MKKVIILCIMMILTVGCDENSQSNQSVDTTKMTTQATQEVTTKAETMKPETTPVETTKAETTKAETTSAETPKVEKAFELPESIGDGTFTKNHYHSTEVHKGVTYGIYEYPNDGANYILKRFAKDGNSQDICAFYSIDFRATTNNEYVAVANGESLCLYNADNMNIFMKKYENLGFEADYEFDLQLEGWDDANTTIWAHAYIAADILGFISRNIETREIKTYNVGVNHDYALNKNTGKIVFSDFPEMFDVDSYNEYMASGEVNTLSVYDLNNDTVIDIGQETTNEFKPVWVDDTTIKYYVGEEEKLVTIQ